MAAYAALVSVINTIQQFTTHPRLSYSLDNHQTQILVEKAGLLLDFIEADNYGGGSRKARDLEREIAAAAHAAEDTIESHITDQIHAGTCELPLDLQLVIQDIDAVIEKARNIMGSGKTAMVGVDGELLRLLDELTGGQSSRKIISIVGLGGAGKTTLAKNAYEHPLIKDRFQIRAWATVSQQYNVKEILSQLLSAQGQSSHGDADDLGLRLLKTLTGRRYLIVLDDVWSSYVWDEVRHFFPHNGNGSRVVLTTRLSDVAMDCGSCCIMKNLLDENESWGLFCKTAFQHEDCPPELEAIGKEIVESCRGLPLAIVVIGGCLLKSPQTVGYWEEVAEDIESTLKNEDSLDVFYALFCTIYYHLPHHLKPCFLYAGVYKWGHSMVSVTDIIRLWVAEGLLESSDDYRVLEDIAEDYLKDLIDRNLILVDRRSDSGKVKSYDIHDILRDLCVRLAEQQGFFRVSRWGILQDNDRRFISSKCCRMAETPHSLARSIIAFGVRGQVLDECRLLRILKSDQRGGGDGDGGDDDDDDHCTIEEVFGCVNLRYVDLDCYWRVLELSTSVSLPRNLQTLIFKRLASTIVVPIEIWGMQQLRHVECSGIYLPHPCSSDGEVDFLILENFQTLKTAVNLKLSEEVCRLIPNIKKLNVVYDHDLHGYDVSSIECLRNLDCLHKLESLSLCIKSFRYGCLLDFKLTLPRSLHKLRLSDCRLKWEDLIMIGSLPQLEVLKLGQDSVTGGEPHWSPVPGQFLRLKFLEMSHVYLKYWDADFSHFPVLEKLVLSHLWELEEIPGGIFEIPTLQLIRLEKCSMSAAILAIKIKHEQLQVELDPSYEDRFREVVRREGLPIHDIQLETRY